MSYSERNGTKKKIIIQINDNDNASFNETNENPIDNNDQYNSTLFNDTNKKIIKIQKIIMKIQIKMM